MQPNKHFKAFLTHHNQFGLQGFEVYDVKGTNEDSQGDEKHWRADSEEKKSVNVSAVNNPKIIYDWIMQIVL